MQRSLQTRRTMFAFAVSALLAGRVVMAAAPGVGAQEHPLPLPTTLSHLDYEKQLFPFIQSRAYATTLGWSHDKRVRDTGAYIKGKYYGTHPAVRCFYSPKVMYWLTGDPAFWPEGQAAGLAPPKPPRAGAIPDGGMIIKEMLPPPAARYEGMSEDELLAVLRLPTSAGCDVMIKDSAGSPDGWFWASVYPGQKADTPDSFAYPQAGFTLACVRCHSVAQEGGTFSSLRNIAGFPGEPLQFFVDHTWRDIPTALQPYDFRHDPEPPSLQAPQAPGPARPNFEFLHTFAGTRPVTYPEVEKFPPESNDHVTPHPTTPQRFVTSDQCLMCHSAATGRHSSGPVMFLETKRGGLNVSPYGEWRWSPMGLAGRDPIFHAQLESELAQLTRDHPKAKAQAYGDQVVNTCLRCHGAMGKRQHDVDRGVGDHYWAAQANFQQDWFQIKDPNDPHHRYGGLARDGISCTVCHGMVEEYADLQDFLANSITGQFKTGPAHEIYGPFKDVVTKPMQTVLGAVPKHNPFIQSSRMCGSCHVINLPVVDWPLGQTPKGVKPPPRDQVAQLLASEKNPNFQGFTHRIEQATYLEWLNSDFQDEFGTTASSQSCQDCHMPKGYESPDGEVAIEQIATKIAVLQDQEYPEVDNAIPTEEHRVTFREQGFRRHTFQGMNVFLMEVFRQFDDVLGVRQPDYETGVEGIHFAIDNYVQNARKNTATLEIMNLETAGQTLAADVKVTNLTGHRLPSGVGFRRLWIEFLLIDSTHGRDRIIWSSGLTNGAGVIVGNDGRVLPSEFFETVGQGSQQAYQPHHRVIDSPEQVQVYEELTQDARGAFTTSFLHRARDVKDNRLLPKGWSAAGPDPSMPAAFVEATHPHGVGDDPQYADGSGSDIVSYRVTVPECFDCRKLRVKATLYSQAWAPYYLRDRFQDIPEGPEGDARRRLFYLLSHLKTAGTVIDGWKFEVASDEEEVTESNQTEAISRKRCS
jgi:cytochrome c553